MPQNRPTEKQQIALRKFGVNEELIQNMTFQDASSQLNQLINKARSKNQATPLTTKGASQAPAEAKSDTSRSPADEAQLELRIENRLKQAKDIVDSTFPEASGYSDYLSIITEVFHQIGSEQWLQMEKRKAKI